MRRRLSREDGFSLPEMLTAITIAMIVSLATFALIEFTMKRAGEVDMRVDSTQRGRAIMDTVERQLRSQVCLNATTAAMATRTGDVTDATTATFYADFTDGTDPSKPPADLHRLRFDATARQITDTTYKTSWDKSTTPWTAVVPAAPTSTRIVANDVVQNGSLPIFTYYAYNGADPPAPINWLPPGAGGLTVLQLGLVARIDITFRTLAFKKSRPAPYPPNLRGSVVLQDQVYVRAADPNDDAPTPTCA